MSRNSATPPRRSNLAIGRRLRRLRELQNLTQAQIAVRVGVSTPAWNNYERGGNSPRWQTAIRIADVCGVTIDWIYSGEVGGLSVLMWRRLGGPDV